MAIMGSSFFHCLHFLFFSFLLFRSCCLNKAYAYGGRGRGQGTMKSHHVIEIKSLLTSTVCSDSFTKGPRQSPATLRMAHVDGPCAPLNHRANTKTLNPLQILLQDQIRVRYLHSRISTQVKNTEEQVIPVSPGDSFATGNFIVTIGFGTPKLDLSLAFDTGSDLTWIQCQPCVSCYPQRDPTFDPSKSSSYSNISCSSMECSQLKSGTSSDPRCSSTTCVYQIQYGDQSYSVGCFAREALTLTSSNVFPNFQFGCGINNHGLFGKIAGLLGLGRDKISLVSQTSQEFGKIFSYCIPPTASSTGYLEFGATTKTGLKYTSLLTDAREPSFYFLNLLGISVADQKLAIPPSAFTSSGTIIDSGTIITRLPQTAYSALKSAFQNLMSNYPSAQPDSLLDTCYDLSGFNTFTTPKITLHFDGGVDVDLDKSGALYTLSASQICLAFAGNTNADDLTILGNTQQRALEVVYDVAGGKIGFGTGDCS